MNESYEDMIQKQLKSAYVSASLGFNPPDPLKPWWDNPNNWYQIEAMLPEPPWR